MEDKFKKDIFANTNEDKGDTLEGRLKRILKENRGKFLFVRFSNHKNILEPNPNYEFKTPFGIYAYPFNSKWIDNLINQNIPYAFGSKYIGVFEWEPANTDKRTIILNSSHEAIGYTKSDFLRDYKILEELYFKDNEHVSEKFALAEIDKILKSSKYNTLFNKIYNFSRVIANDARRWTNILKTYLNISCIYDREDSGTIHISEPTQALFFEPEKAKLLFITENIFNKNNIKVDGNMIIKKYYENKISFHQFIKEMEWVPEFFSSYGVTTNKIAAHVLSLIYLKQKDDHYISNKFYKKDGYDFIESTRKTDFDKSIVKYKFIEKNNKIYSDLEILTKIESYKKYNFDDSIAIVKYVIPFKEFFKEDKLIYDFKKFEITKRKNIHNQIVKTATRRIKDGSVEEIFINNELSEKNWHDLNGNVIKRIFYKDGIEVKNQRNRGIYNNDNWSDEWDDDSPMTYSDINPNDNAKVGNNAKVTGNASISMNESRKILTEAKKTSLNGEYIKYIFFHMYLEGTSFNNTKEQIENINKYNDMKAFNNFYYNPAIDKIIKSPPKEFNDKLSQTCISWITNKIINYNDNNEMNKINTLLWDDIGEESKATEYFRNFFKYNNRFPKGKSKNILDYDELSDIFKAYKPYIQYDQTNYSSNLKDDEYDVIFSDSKMVVVVPLTAQASCELGKNTEWCTAKYKVDDQRNMFYTYTETAPLFIVFDKVKQERYQLFYNKSNKDIQFMDETDSIFMMNENFNIIDIFNIIKNSKYKEYVDNIEIDENGGLKLENRTLEFNKNGYIQKDYMTTEGEIGLVTYLHQVSYNNIQGKKHKDDGPALIQYNKDGSVYRERWHTNGEIYRPNESKAADIFYINKGKVSTENYYSKLDDGIVINRPYTQGPCSIDYTNGFITKYYCQLDTKGVVPRQNVVNQKFDLESKGMYPHTESIYDSGLVVKFYIFKYNGKIYDKQDYLMPNANKDPVYKTHIRDNVYFNNHSIEKNIPAIYRKYKDGTIEKEFYDNGNQISKVVETLQEGKFQQKALIGLAEDSIMPKFAALSDLCTFLRASYQYGNIPNDIDDSEEKKLSKWMDISMSYEEFIENATVDLGRLIKASIHPKVTDISKDVERFKLYTNEVDKFIKHVLAMCRYYKSKQYIDLTDPKISEMMKKYYI